MLEIFYLLLCGQNSAVLIYLEVIWSILWKFHNQCNYSYQNDMFIWVLTIIILPIYDILMSKVQIRCFNLGIIVLLTHACKIKQLTLTRVYIIISWPHQRNFIKGRGLYCLRNKELNGPSPISLAYSMTKLCVAIDFVPFVHIVSYIKPRRKYLLIFLLKVYNAENLLIKTVHYAYQHVCLPLL